MKWGKWSQTAGSNSATPPDGWPEGQAPSTVNDCAREMMAAIRSGLVDLQYVDQGVTPTFATATTFTLAGDQTFYFGVGQRVKAQGATTVYGTVTSASFTTNTGVTLRLDSGVLDASLTAVASGIITPLNQSLPETAYKADNVLTNPYCELWQRGNSFQFGTSSVAQTADMFRMINNSPAGSINLTRAASAPTVAQCGQLINSSIQISVSATGSMAAGSAYASLQTHVEGFEWRSLAQKPASFQFWVAGNRTGTYCVGFSNSTGDRSLVLEYSLSSVNTWERKTFLLPESPAAGTWDYSSGTGLRISLALGCGTVYRAGAGNWTATNAIATANQINFFASAGNTIAFTGFKLNEGPYPQPLESRPYQAELAKSCRYNVVFGANSAAALAPGQVINVGQAIVQIPFQTQTRVPPTGVTLNSGTTNTFCLVNNNGGLAQVSAIAFSNATIYGASLQLVTVGGNGLGASGQATVAYMNGVMSIALTGPEMT